MLFTFFLMHVCVLFIFGTNTLPLTRCLTVFLDSLSLCCFLLVLGRQSGGVNTLLCWLYTAGYLWHKGNITWWMGFSKVLNYLAITALFPPQCLIKKPSYQTTLPIFSFEKHHWHNPQGNCLCWNENCCAVCRLQQCYVATLKAMTHRNNITTLIYLHMTSSLIHWVTVRLACVS